MARQSDLSLLDSTWDGHGRWAGELVGTGHEGYPLNAAQAEATLSGFLRRPPKRGRHLGGQEDLNGWSL